MPEGEIHTVEGTLRWSHIGYLIESEKIGYLLTDMRAIDGIMLLDKPVTATGTMIEFSILEVQNIALTNKPQRKGWWERITGGLF